MSGSNARRLWQPLKKKKTEQSLNWFQRIPLLAKIGFAILIIALGVVIYWRIKTTLRKKDVQDSFEQPSNLSLNTTAGNIHILIHLYRANPDVVARTIFGAFEAAKYPGRIHIHLFQELCLADRYPRDAFSVYKHVYAPRHSWDTRRFNLERNVHVVNENPTQSAGRLVSLFTLTQESLVPILGPSDIIIVPQAFYDVPGTDHLFHATFAQDYDALLQPGSLTPQTIYSGCLPRTSLSVANAAQTTRLTSSVAYAIGENLVVPFLKSKQHANYLESRTLGVCSAAAARNLYVDQASFTSFTTSDRIVNPSTRQTTSADVPFTSCRRLREFYAPSTQDDAMDWSIYSGQHGAELVRPIPTVGVHEDVLVCTGQTWVTLTQFARGPGRPALTPGPEYLQTLVLSNLLFQARINLMSSNHLPILVVFDHLTGTSATTDLEALNRTKSFEPHNWLVALLPVDPSTPGQLAPVLLDDPCDLVQLDPAFEAYAGVTADNVTQNGFLGITAVDGPNILTHKFSSLKELERQKRMLAATQYLTPS